MPSGWTSAGHPDLGLALGAGDENRTRTISLGIRPIHAVRAADQPGPSTASTLTDPSLPWLIARELHDLVRTSATKEDQPLALLRDQLLSVAIQTSPGGAQRRRLRSSVSVPCWSNSIA